ncbi:putative DNA-binding protein (MmcQ/YjbR family) [Thermocatellispora tengchongensis]|uniref:Putative DNA-binding protein (MmcQ/YjbR family) n=1 Tax=Thermocatellispora tengchongensis TaxID=1073253 RepID=A0A840PN90_9ACTN|nr:MmcQ/YjbR family DNA-binding protein [Thermocatellispora tengchongensis]MBB5138517.1 putative DNA-binding protein (MmcQ/YjbR family) [Thermocatellispora tengchongensis]
MSDWREAREALRAYALGLPEAWEDFPWGDCVVKVRKKVFLFLGIPEPTEKWTPGFTVKLPVSGGHALSVPGAEPAGYGLGKAGWVRVPFMTDELPETDLLLDWVEESYRAVAPKTLVALLDETGGTPR